MPAGPPPTMATSQAGALAGPVPGGAAGGAGVEDDAGSTQPSTIIGLRPGADPVLSILKVAKEHVAAWCGARLLVRHTPKRKEGRNEDLEGHHPHPPADEDAGR